MNRLPQHSLRKVPEITAIFWVVKLLTTAMGEATSDFLVFRINPYLAVTIAGIVFAVVLLIQFSVKKYVPSIYWLTVAMVAIFGTMAADGLHIRLGVSYIVSTVMFSFALIFIFGIWYMSEKTLSIHSIKSRRREFFYWSTVLATFALGTASGDLTATTFGLGYFVSALLFTGLIAIPAIGYWLFGLNEVIAFWVAYILTRPIGASFADWFSKPQSVGGLGFGDGHIALILTVIIVVFIGYMTLSRREMKKEL